MSIEAGGRDALKRYVQRGMWSIPGWLSPVDANLLAAVAGAQRRGGLRGDILEIGAFHGRTAVLLGHMLAPDEHLWVCDVFEEAPSEASEARMYDRFYRGLTQRRFERHYRRHHEKPARILAQPSHEIADMLPPEDFRLVHVDGGHAYDDVRGDLQLARAALQAYGMVVLDDWRTAHSPGVAAATWQAVFEEGLVPVFVTDAKLYAVWESSAASSYQEMVLDAEPVWSTERHMIQGRQLLRVLAPPSDGLHASRLAKAASMGRMRLRGAVRRDPWRR